MTMKVEPSGQTISWFKDRLDEERLEFKPPFQRNPVWAEKHKSYLVDTALRSLPIPEIYVQKETDPEGRTVFAIIDGQQRLRALLGFVVGEVELDDEYSPGRGEQTWEDLTNEEKKNYWNYRLVVREVTDATDAELRDLFRRLNQNTVKLNSQEIRNARYQGDYIKTVTELADQPFWAEQGIVSASEIRRMLDIEFMAELLLSVMLGRQNKKQGLEAAFQTYEQGITDKQRWLSRFEGARATIEKLVPDLRKSRWSKKSDFYSLFLAADALNEKGLLRKGKVSSARAALLEFGESVSNQLSRDGKKQPASSAVAKYANAVEKAASDKDRRETRHAILTELLAPYFG